jgi:carbon monoxide dehydrogenase subunit G
MHSVTSVVVNRPMEDVWAFLIEPFNAPRISGSTLAYRWTSPAPHGLGSTYQGRWKVFGFEIRVNGEFVDWDPPHSATLSFRGAIGSGLLSQRLEPVADGTRVVRVSDVDPRLALKPLFWLAGPYIRHINRVTGRRIKEHLEAEIPAAGAHS